jgi:hypothetical protein
MARLFALVLLAHTVLAVGTLISCLSAESDEIRGLPRLAWVPVILLVPLVGPIAWFMAGRRVPDGTADRWPFGKAIPGSPRRPVAPDDDPDFLRSLDTTRSKEDRDLFEQWEKDLRRREDDLRRGSGEDPHRRTGDGNRSAESDELRPRKNEEGQPEG